MLPSIWGSIGPELKLAQEALQKRGYNPQLIDGLFGPRTRHAVRHYGW